MGFRVSSASVAIPDGVNIDLSGAILTVKGRLGELVVTLHEKVNTALEDGLLRFSPTVADNHFSVAITGTMRAIVSNAVFGVDKGWEKRLQLVGVGYRAQVQGKKLTMALGFSHPIDYVISPDIEIAVPSQTEIIVKGMDRQKVGQVAAELRAFRPPEPYKGKGVRYVDERIIRKEAKKK